MIMIKSNDHFMDTSLVLIWCLDRYWARSGQEFLFFFPNANDPVICYVILGNGRTAYDEVGVVLYCQVDLQSFIDIGVTLA